MVHVGDKVGRATLSTEHKDVKTGTDSASGPKTRQIARTFAFRKDRLIGDRQMFRDDSQDSVMMRRGSIRLRAQAKGLALKIADDAGEIVTVPIHPVEIFHVRPHLLSWPIEPDHEVKTNTGYEAGIDLIGVIPSG